MLIVGRWEGEQTIEQEQNHQLNSKNEEKKINVHMKRQSIDSASAGAQVRAHAHTHRKQNKQQSYINRMW